MAIGSIHNIAQAPGTSQLHITHVQQVEYLPPSLNNHTAVIYDKCLIIAMLERLSWLDLSMQYFIEHWLMNP